MWFALVPRDLEAQAGAGPHDNVLQATLPFGHSMLSKQPCIAEMCGVVDGLTEQALHTDT